ncbi:hypothetical protein RI367_008322 [Sorochytrium milnesiophthora]
MLHSATAQLFLLLVLMAVLPDALSDNVPSYMTPLDTKIFNLFTPEQVFEGTVLTTVESSIHLPHYTRPSHSAALKLETWQGSLTMGLHVDQDGYLNWFCRTKSKDHRVKELTFPARASSGLKTDIFHDVGVRIQVIKRGKGQHELQGSVAEWSPLSCHTILSNVTKPQLTATLTSSPLSDPKHAETPVTASFKYPNITNHFLPSPENEPVELRLKGKSILENYPVVVVKTFAHSASITHSWDKTKLRQSQRSPSTSRRTQQSMRSPGSGKPQGAQTAPTSGDSLKKKYNELFKNSLSKKP